MTKTEQRLSHWTEQRKRAETIARTIAKAPLAVNIVPAIHLALDATDKDAAAWAAFIAGQELGENVRNLRASHGRLLKKVDHYKDMLRATTGGDTGTTAYETLSMEMGSVASERDRLRASHHRLLKACEAGQAYMACLKRCWAKDDGRLIDSRGVVVAETAELDRLFDLWQTATTAAIAQVKEAT